MYRESFDVVRRSPAVVVATSKVTAGFVLFAAVAVGIGLYATAPAGVEIPYDGYFYIDGAKNLLNGDGYKSTLHSPATVDAYPITHFPPGTSLLIAATNVVIPDLFEALRVLSLVVFGISVTLFGLLAYQATNSVWAGFVGALLFVTARGVVFSLFLSAMSDGPFLLFYLSSVFFISLYSEKHKLRDLVISALFSGAAFMTRYSGVVVVVSCASYLMFVGGGTLRMRLKQVLIFSGTAAVISVPFFVRNISVAGQLTSRNIAFHPPNQHEWGSLFTNLAEWVLPGRVVAALPVFAHVGVVISLFALIALSYVLMRKGRPPQQESAPCGAIPDVMLTFAVLYLPFLVFSKTFFDEDMDLNTRQLLPFIVSIIVVVLVLIVAISRKNSLRIMVVACAVFFVSFYSRSFAATVSEFRNHTSMNSSPLLNRINQLEKNTLIITNNELLVELFTDRNVSVLPRKRLGINKKTWENLAYDDEMTLMLMTLKERGGAIVFFYTSRIDDDSLLEDAKTASSNCQILHFCRGEILVFGAS